MGDYFSNNANIVDEDCTAQGSWTEQENGDGHVSWNQTVGGRSGCLDLLTGSSTGQLAGAYQDFSDAGGSRRIVSLATYFENIGNHNSDDFRLTHVYDGSNWQLRVSFGTDGLYIDDGGGYQQVSGVTVDEDAWHVWTFDIDISAKTCDVYKDGIKEASGVDCSDGSALGDCYTMLYQYNVTQTSQRTHIDWLKVGDSLVIESEIADSSDAGDTMEAEGGSILGEIADSAGADETIAATVDFESSISDGADADDTMAPTVDYEISVAESAGADDEISGFNFTDWLRKNKHLCAIRYVFTLTGSADSKDDVDIPIQSASARWRSGDPSYLEMVIPAVNAYSAQINDRPNGELVLTMAYYYKGVLQLTEELMRVDLETVRIDEGFRSESITLSGHKTETYAGNTITLQDVTYRTVSGGLVRLRTATPNLYLRPGDTVLWDTDEFTAGLVTLSINQRQSTMEVAEAA